MTRRTSLAMGVVVGLSAMAVVAWPAQPMVRALVLARDVPADAVLRMADLTVAWVPESLPPTSRIAPRHAPDLEGFLLKHELSRGDLLRSADLGERPGAVLEGYRLLEVRLAPDSQAERGDRVDLVGVAKGSAFTVLKNAELRAQVGPTATILVPAEQAERVLIASEEAKLRLTLRHPNDTDGAPAGQRVVAIDQLLHPGPPRPPARPTHLHLIRGD